MNDVVDLDLGVFDGFLGLLSRGIGTNVCKWVKTVSCLLFANATMKPEGMVFFFVFFFSFFAPH